MTDNYRCCYKFSNTFFLVCGPTLVTTGFVAFGTVYDVPLLRFEQRVAWIFQYELVNKRIFLAFVEQVHTIDWFIKYNWWKSVRTCNVLRTCARTYVVSLSRSHSLILLYVLFARTRYVTWMNVSLAAIAQFSLFVGENSIRRTEQFWIESNTCTWTL